MSQVTLRVKESLKRDAGRGIARIDTAIMDELGLSPGDLTEVKGGRSTVAKVMPGYPQDKGSDILRIDGTIRANAKAGIDDRVTIRKIPGENARKVTLAPTEPIEIVGGEEMIVRVLESLPVAIGDRIRINFLGTPLEFAVVDFKPKAGAGVITSETVIEISEKTAAEGRRRSPRLLTKISGASETRSREYAK